MSATGAPAIRLVHRSLPEFGLLSTPGASSHNAATTKGSPIATISAIIAPNQQELAIDHKSFPGSRAQAVERAKGYAGQLGAYAEVLRLATGKEVAGAFVHLPVSGAVIPVRG